MILLHNCETGEVTEVSMTADQIAEKAAADEELNNKLAAREAVAELKTSAMAKLAALGLTEDEAKAILG